MSYLECIHIQKAFGAVIALQDATLNVEKGDIHAILGGNGSGKSTLAKIIGGSVFMDDGEILIDGKKAKIDSPIKAREMGIVVTSQELSLFNHQTVEENLTLLEESTVLKIFKDKKKSTEKAKEILKRLGLENIQHQKVGNLPENKKYLVEFAKAIQYNPKILVIDEITSALFRDEVKMVKEILNELAEKGCSIIFISHRLQEIYSIASTITVMRNGQVINTHTLDDSEEKLLCEMIGSDSLFVSEEKEKKTINISDHQKNILLSIQNFIIPGFKEKMNFEIKEGEMIGIAGLQGQGQSQMLRSLFGINNPVNVTIKGMEKKIDSPRRAIREGLAYLSGDRQKEGVYYGRSIYENISVVNTQVLPKNTFDENEIMRKFGVKYKSKNQEIQTLSGGNQQKVVAARWVGVKPKLILADDPTKGIDVLARKEVHEIFSDLVKQGTSIVMSSSDDEELVKISEIIPDYKVFVMYNGQIVKVLEGKEINISNIISNSMPRGEKHE